MNKINRLFAYILSVVLALGTINPFALNSNVDEPTESIMVSLFSVLFIVITYFHYGLKGFMGINKRIVVSSLFLIGFILVADIIYSLSTIDFYFYFKFFVVLLAFFSFLVFSQNNPDMIQRCMMLFSLSCAILIFLAFTTNLFGYAVTYKGRLILFGENPNSTSSRMSMAIIFFTYLFFLKDSKKYLKMLWGACIIMLFLYVIRSGSRGSFLVTILGAFLVFSSSRGSLGNKTLFVVIGLVISFLFLPSIMQKEDVALFQRIEDLEDRNVREDLMEQAFIIFVDNPVVGVGYNGYGHEKAIRNFDHRDSHNIVTSILAMGGLFGFLSFLILWISLITPAIRSRKETITPLILNISMLLISMKTGGIITYVLMWFIYAVSYSWSSANMILKTSNSK